MEIKNLLGLILFVAVLLLLIITIISMIFPKIGHAIFGWHRPNDKIGHDGCSFTSTCKYCGKEILLDSQGNWF